MFLVSSEQDVFCNNEILYVCNDILMAIFFSYMAALHLCINSLNFSMYNVFFFFKQFKPFHSFNMVYLYISFLTVITMAQVDQPKRHTVKNFLFQPCAQIAERGECDMMLICWHTTHKRNSLGFTTLHLSVVVNKTLCY